MPTLPTYFIGLNFLNYSRLVSLAVFLMCVCDLGNVGSIGNRGICIGGQCKVVIFRYGGTDRGRSARIMGAIVRPGVCVWTGIGALGCGKVARGSGRIAGGRELVRLRLYTDQVGGLAVS